jgi:hypothetical protein
VFWLHFFLPFTYSGLLDRACAFHVVNIISDDPHHLNAALDIYFTAASLPFSTKCCGALRLRLCNTEVYTEERTLIKQEDHWGSKTK